MKIIKYLLNFYADNDKIKKNIENSIEKQKY